MPQFSGTKKGAAVSHIGREVAGGSLAVRENLFSYSVLIPSSCHGSTLIHTSSITSAELTSPV